jgi:hypothetical protein
VAMLAGGVAFGGIFSSAAALEEGQSQVRVIHNSPDAPAVDIFVNGERAVEGLAFGDSTPLVELPSGDIDVAVAPAGSPAADAVISATLPLESCASYEVAAVGDLANIGAQVYPIDTSDIADGNARVRAIHNSPDAPAVDIAVQGGPVLFSNLAFPDASQYAEVAAGTYDLEIRVAGTEDVALSIPGVALDADTIYDVFANGTLADGTLGVLPLTAETDPCGTDAAAPAGTTDATGATDTTGVADTGTVGTDAQADDPVAAVAENTGQTDDATQPAVGGMAPTEMPVAGVGPMQSPIAGWALAASVLAAAGAAAIALRSRLA